jgi:hypothetical protein
MLRQPLLPGATHKIFVVSFALPRNNSRSIAPTPARFPYFSFIIFGHRIATPVAERYENALT